MIALVGMHLSVDNLHRLTGLSDMAELLGKVELPSGCSTGHLGRGDTECPTARTPGTNNPRLIGAVNAPAITRQ